MISEIKKKFLSHFFDSVYEIVKNELMAQEIDIGFRNTLLLKLHGIERLIEKHKKSEFKIDN